MAQAGIGSLVVMDRGRWLAHTFAEVLQALAERGGTLGDPVSATRSESRSRRRRRSTHGAADHAQHARYVPVMDGTTLLGVDSFHDVAMAVLEEQSLENRMLKGYISDSLA
jgi:hypothetical protein